MAKGLGTWIVGITEHRRVPGTARPIQLLGTLPGLAVVDAAVPDDAELLADLELEVLVDGRLTAMGTIRAPWEGRCRRCLQPVSGIVEVEVSEVFETDPAPHASHEEAETYPLAGDRVDLEPMVRDSVLLALPLAPLCREDCPGPDPDDHPVTLPSEGVPAPAQDPRWAGLAELRFD